MGQKKKRKDKEYPDIKNPAFMKSVHYSLVIADFGMVHTRIWEGFSQKKAHGRTKSTMCFRF
jgi:hypothetical protein